MATGFKMNQGLKVAKLDMQHLYNSSFEKYDLEQAG